MKMRKVVSAMLVAAMATGMVEMCIRDRQKSAQDKHNRKQKENTIFKRRIH